MHKQFFGDAEHAFRLDPGMTLELERIVGSGIGAISRRFFAGDFSFSELTETLRLGLVGGGMDPKEAAALVITYADRMAVTDLYAKALPVIEKLMFADPAEKVPSTKFIANGEDTL
ncbi:hypothetical protein ASG39_11260 [Rhizobium sp. Leaf371]|uniref:gene transfer agent family protein n=1 Tax=Rhizobium sp. Leaf371 TaxID=1736355 RepID=UPI000714807E|nr:gene transfer agent family protein [Rhizobium sp. Leaf371]KQS64526.1 hypothetical protein ASG39_11260 [Rhizobium sp. Leaf371]